jgi:hypothetical protein
MTLGTMLTSIVQFIVIVGILAPVLTLTTIGGGGVLTPGFAASFNDVIANTTNYYVNPNGPLEIGFNNVTTQTQNGLAVGGALSSIGGLAFIPAGFGLFINLMWNSPQLMLRMFSTLLTPGAAGSGAYITLSVIASMDIISACFLAYCVGVMVMKIMTPISKVEIEDV